MPAGEPEAEIAADRGDERARVLAVVLGDRLPALVPYLPYVGIALGLAWGGTVYLLLDTDAVLVRETALVAAVVLGSALGRLAETRAGRWVAARAERWTIEPEPVIPADLTAEFRHTVRDDPREAARGRRPAI